MSSAGCAMLQVRAPACRRGCAALVARLCMQSRSGPPGGGSPHMCTASMPAGAGPSRRRVLCTTAPWPQHARHSTPDDKHAPGMTPSAHLARHSTAGPAQAAQHAASIAASHAFPVPFSVQSAAAPARQGLLCSASTRQEDVPAERAQRIRDRRGLLWRQNHRGSAAICRPWLCHQRPYQ